MRSHDVRIAAAGALLGGELRVPADCRGAVVFAHGSGVTRRDARNRLVARELRKAGIATLLVDLLDADECRDRHNVFDVELQASRLLAVTRWLDKQRLLRALKLGYYGTGVGAGAALLAAATEPARVAAVVCAGGRPDTALFQLPAVRAATLFIADDTDLSARECIDAAYRRVAAEKALVVVAGAGYAFERPGAIESVARHARRWFVRHLAVDAAMRAAHSP